MIYVLLFFFGLCTNERAKEKFFGWDHRQASSHARQAGNNEQQHSERVVGRLRLGFSFTS